MKEDKARIRSSSTHLCKSVFTRRVHIACDAPCKVCKSSQVRCRFMCSLIWSLCLFVSAWLLGYVTVRSRAMQEYARKAPPGRGCGNSQFGWRDPDIRLSYQLSQAIQRSCKCWLSFSFSAWILLCRSIFVHWKDAASYSVCVPLSGSRCRPRRCEDSAFLRLPTLKVAVEARFTRQR